LHFLHQREYKLKAKFEKANPENGFISEITLAELKFGVENSKKKKQNQAALGNFLKGITIIPICHALDLYAKEKARLRLRLTTLTYASV